MSDQIDAQDVLSIIKQVMASEREAQKDFAETLAYKITHPDMTPEQLAAKDRAIKERIELAQLQEENRKQARLKCPHRRIGGMWGMFNGSSVIAWHYTKLSERDERGQPKPMSQCPDIAIGVCLWCQSEFKPGDPDYYEKLSWGDPNPVAMQANMNLRTGLWEG